MLSIYLYILASGYPVTARKFPRLVLVLIMLLTTADILNRLFAKKGQETAKDAPPGPKAPEEKKINFYFTVVSVFLFYFLMVLFGFTLGTMTFLLLSAFCLGYRKVVSMVVSALVITGFLYLIFIVLMNSFLPQGLLFQLLGR